MAATAAAAAARLVIFFVSVIGLVVGLLIIWVPRAIPPAVRLRTVSQAPTDKRVYLPEFPASGKHQIALWHLCGARSRGLFSRRSIFIIAVDIFVMVIASV